MFEFHGWIRIETAEESPGASAILAAANEIIRPHSDTLGIVEARHTGNDMVVVLIHGLRNHWHPRILELFETIGKSFPLSYGLLHVRDQEGPNVNEFRIFRMARGAVQERTDPIFSPCIPVIEDEYPAEEDELFSPKVPR